MVDAINLGKVRGLFQVYVVYGDFVEDPVVVVAGSPDAAKPAALRKIGYLSGSVSDYDFAVRRLGDVRAKKEVQEVRVVTNVANRGTFSAATAGGGQSNVASGDTSIIAGGIDNTAKAWRDTHG